MAKNRNLIIDGTNLFTIQYMKNPSTDLNGNPAGGVKGTLTALKNLCKTLKPTKVFCVFDGQGGSAKRREVFSEYKEGRKPTEKRNVAGRYYQFTNADQALENKHWQLKTLKKCIKCLPVCTITTKNIEADDAIAYIVNHSDYFGHKCNIIVTCDKDFNQLINGNKTVVYNPMNKKLINEQSLLEEYRIHPKNWLFYRAIDGDSADNIKGVKGFGPKTIVKLFNLENSDRHNPEDIYGYKDTAEDDKKKKKYEKLLENKDVIERNWSLMSLQKDDILMDANDKDKICDQVENFTPELNVKQFYITLSKLGLSIETNFVENFRGLV